MRKKVILVLLAGCLCCSTAAMVSYAETPAHALTIIASVTNLSVSKNTIAVGESVQLELEWSTGAKQSVFYSSSDENVAIVDQNGYSQVLQRHSDHYSKPFQYWKQIRPLP